VYAQRCSCLDLTVLHMHRWPNHVLSIKSGETAQAQSFDSAFADAAARPFPRNVDCEVPIACLAI